MENPTIASLQSLLSSLLPGVVNYQITWTSRADQTSGMLTLTLFSATEKRTMHWYSGELSEKGRLDICERLACMIAVLSTIDVTMSLTVPLSAAESPAAGSRRGKRDKTTGKAPPRERGFTGLFGPEAEESDG